MAKNYIKGSFRKLNTPTSGEVIIASVLVSDLQKLANDKGYANIVISERREKDEYGNTHYAYENDYNPEKKANVKENRVNKMNPPNFAEQVSTTATASPKTVARSAKATSDDLPF